MQNSIDFYKGIFLDVIPVRIIVSWNKFSEKRKPLTKNWSTIFWLKVLRFKTQHIHTKLTCPKPVLRQIELGVQNEPITENGVLPKITLFFGKFCFNLRTSFIKS